MTREIELTQGKVAIVDDADYELVAGHKWHARRRGSEDNQRWYAQSSVWSSGRSTKVQMHRMILAAPKGSQVDHINHNGLDNRRANLRMCTGSQNQGNRRKQTGTSSCYKGVCWHRDHGKWIAYIGDPMVHLGYYDSESNAARAYNEAALERWGEFACLNDVAGGGL